MERKSSARVFFVLMVNIQQYNIGYKLKKIVSEFGTHVFKSKMN